MNRAARVLATMLAGTLLMATACGSEPATATGHGQFPGDVAPGYVRWGAAVGGNSDPTQRHETPSGKSMGIRRTYYSWANATTKMIDTARSDLAKDRLPWVSIKTPDWALMASGQFDGEIDSMLRALDDVGGPVWLTVHHEPEGGGGAAGPDDPSGAPAWRAMQVKVRERMTAVGTKNIAFAPTLMSWTFDPESGRNPDDWWVDGVWDFAGIDHYYMKRPGAPLTEDDQAWTRARAFYAAKGKLPIAFGEWGNRGADDDAAAEMEAAYDTALESAGSGHSRIIGLAYFDSGLNSPTGSWALKGDPLSEFHDLQGRPTSLLADEDGYQP
jgi:hypothetical protein